MRVRLNVVLNASEDYSCGDCKKCPIHQESYFSTHQYEEVKISCPLGYTSVCCPLEPQVELETPKSFINKPCISEYVCREDKIIDEHYKKGFASGIRTVEWRYNNAKKEIKEHADRRKDSLFGDGLRYALEIIDKYKVESEVDDDDMVKGNK